MTVTTTVPGLATTLEYLRHTDSALSFFDRALTKGNDRNELAEWIAQAQAIRLDAQKTADCAIALLGESGAGKSSLLNAMVRMDLLPHDAAAAVTAAVTELHASPDHFCIEATILARDTFMEQFDEVCGRIPRSSNGEKRTGGSADRSIDDRDASFFQSVTGIDLRDPANGMNTQSLGPKLLLPRVNDMLKQGPVVRLQFDRGDLDGLKKACHELLSSRQPLWPLVQKARISGPFSMLSSDNGLRFIDVPGLNDPDPIRNDLARRSLQSAKQIWLVLNAKRAMTGTITSFLTESSLLTKLELDGRLESLAVVATHADQLDEQGLIQAGHLSEDAPLDQLIQAHSDRVASVVRQSLIRIWDEDVQYAGDNVSRQIAERGRKYLASVPVFSVSSTESLLLRQVVRLKKGPSFETDLQTGIPRLEQWVTTEFLDRERNDHLRRLAHRVQQLREAIRSTLAHRKDVKQKLAQLAEARKGGLKGLQQKAAAFLEERLKEHQAASEAALKVEAQKVKKAIRDGIQAANEELGGSISQTLNSIHWATLRAISRRGGVFYGSTRFWDLPAMIANVIARKIAFRWAEFFESIADHFLNDIALKSSDLLAVHAQFLFGLLASAIGDEVPGLERLKQPTAQLDLKLDLTRAAIAEHLEETRLGFERDVVSALRDGLRPAFDAAADQFGTGMRYRMFEIIMAGLQKLFPKVLPAVTRDLDEKVAEVCGNLRNQVRHAHEEVIRIAKIESENVNVALFQQTPAELKAIAATIENGLRVLDAA